MSSNPSIRVRSLGKCYEVYARPSDRLRQMVLPRVNAWLGKPQRDYCDRFWALSGVDLDVEPGETVGIIGCNGSGKSTLLQLVCGTLTPTTGAVETHGRIGALLELGSGFNPDFTGLENVFLNAAVLGLTREETRERLDAIAEFAGIGSFIHRPVKTYSSGMMVRLAFAVQAQTEPDILIVDEALAVGDVRFQAKCFERLRQLKENGTSILLVTHSSEQIVTHCDRAVLIDEGYVMQRGEPREVVNRYLDLLFGQVVEPASEPAPEPEPEPEKVEFFVEGDGEQAQFSTDDEHFQDHPNANPHEYRWGDGAVSITDFLLEGEKSAYQTVVDSGERVRLSFNVRINQRVRGIIFGVTLKTREGVTLSGSNTEKLGDYDNERWFDPGTIITPSFEFVCRLGPGAYFISVGVASREGELVVPHDRRYDAIAIDVRSVNEFFGLVDLEMSLDKLDLVSQSDSGTVQ